jgi:hypothetical protein
MTTEVIADMTAGKIGGAVIPDMTAGKIGGVTTTDMTAGKTGATGTKRFAQIETKSPALVRGFYTSLNWSSSIPK